MGQISANGAGAAHHPPGKAGFGLHAPDMVFQAGALLLLLDQI